MNKPIFDTNFWRERILDSHGEIHKAVRWMSIDQRRIYEQLIHKIIIQHVKQDDSVIDVGCGPGLLLNIMPPDWKGDYYGVDISPDFVEFARLRYPNRAFAVKDARFMSDVPTREFDWAIAFDFKRMVITNQGESNWKLIETHMKRVADHVLILEPPPETVMEDVSFEILK